MQKEYGFVKLTPSEFESWIDSRSISRTCVRVQQHHTWKPRYSSFNGSNHFRLQRDMKRYHVENNGWSDIGQHFSIFPDGIVVTGRPLNTAPACILNANSGAICIENVGNFDSGGDTMREDQARSIFRVTAALLRKIGISTASKSNVVYHHWYDGSGRLVYYNSGQKSCPGTAFFGGNQLSDFEANFLPRLKSVMGSGGEPPIDVAHWAAVTIDGLTVRSAATSGAALVDGQGPLHFGSVVRVYEVSGNGWFRISQSKQLWIYGRYTRQVRPAVVNTPDTNARIGPGNKFDVDRVFQKGDRVFVLEKKGDWSRTTEEQWIYTDLLNLN